MIYNARKLFLHLLFCSFLLLFPTAIWAISVTQYREKIHQANQSLSSLLSTEESLTQARNVINQQVMLKEIRAKLTVAEKVELDGAIFEVNNQPLLAKLSQIENEPIYSPDRSKLITELSENLSTLEKKLQELESQSLSNRTKDEEKQKLAEILKRVEYQKPAERKETTLQKLWREFWEWLDKSFPKPKMGTPSVGSFEGFSSVLQIILLTVVLGGIGFLVYKFAPFLVNRFNKREKKDKKSRVILGETLAADETSQNLFSEAEMLAREGNLRAAVRKGYIALLCELSDRKIIGLARHKTNRDYLRDVRNRKKLFQNMNALTGNFERTWYGFGSPEQADWDEFREKYKQTVADDSLK